MNATINDKLSGKSSIKGTVQMDCQFLISTQVWISAQARLSAPIKQGAYLNKGEEGYLWSIA